MKPKEDARYSCGIDCARLGEDSSVVMVLEIGDEEKQVPHRVVYIKEIKKNTMDALYNYVLWLHEKFNFERIFVDASGLGSGLADFLIKELNTMKKQKFERPGYHFKYRKTDVVRGISFTIKTKMDMYSHTKLLMEKGMLKLPPNEKLKWQLSSFEYEYTTGGQLKLHHPDTQSARDDFCDSLVLAAQGTREEKGGIAWI